MDEETIEEQPAPWDEGSGLFASTLEDADKVDIWVRGGSGGFHALNQCTVIAADREAVLARDKTGTLLIPTSAIAFVRVGSDEKFIQAQRNAQRPRQARFG